MVLYEYHGRNAQGQAVHGQLEAASADAAADLLTDRGVIPLSIVEYQHNVSFSERWARWRNSGRVETVDLIMFCRQMHTITRADIPLVKGIRGLAATLRHLSFKTTLEDVAERLEAGQELSAAMRHHPKVFNNLFISIVSV